MKHTLLALILFPCILFAQEPEPQQEQEQSEQRYEIDIDYRCKSAIVWGVRMITKKQTGYTHEQANKQLENDYLYGSLGDARPDVIAYMFDIIDIVFKHKEPRTNPEIVEAIKEINAFCVNFMDRPVKQKSIRT